MDEIDKLMFKMFAAVFITMPILMFLGIMWYMGIDYLIRRFLWS
jgi:hypothetical protein